MVMPGDNVTANFELISPVPLEIGRLNARYDIDHKDAVLSTKGHLYVLFFHIVFCFLTINYLIFVNWCPSKTGN